METQIEKKVLKAIKNSKYEESGENYKENTVMIWASGQWETTCFNEYGSRYGSMKVGQITLSKKERDFLNSKIGNHIKIEY